MVIQDTEDTEMTEGTELLSGNDLRQRVIDCAIEVHRALGPGMLESVYETCLAHEFDINGTTYQSQHQVGIEYKGVRLPDAYRIDLLLENSLVIELKGVECINNVHEAQILSYMRLGGFSVGLLINFNVTVLTKGVRRFVL